MQNNLRNAAILGLEGLIETQAAEISHLRIEVTNLNAHVSAVEADALDEFAVEEDDDGEAAVRLGRRPLKDRCEMEHQRDLVLEVLQSDTVNVRAMIEESESADDFRARLREGVGKTRLQERGLSILFNHADKLCAFARESGRYHGDAVGLASAMAGVPEMEPRASFDYFLAKRNRNGFTAQQFAAMQERTNRISRSKRRAPKSNLRSKE